ncbi:hypothetical protein BOTCAL_0010g00390 [Botryotinia calthae]|uniref:cyclin-dependent kinase n=1 Tax=Botryotinia calthae TaxID=38488 RepID=A0A4Y8DIN7_9HELO|nr:hypothetical protein BOTCAL_0010g00390 [Botryotinia calthae]
MSTQAKSRWADDEEDAALDLQRKREKEEKKRLKAEKQRKLDEQAAAAASAKSKEQAPPKQEAYTERPSKRRRLSHSPAPTQKLDLPPAKLLRFPAPNWGKCRSVEDYDKLNDIEEGAYGWVSRAKDSRTGKVVALKRLKMENANDGVPVTGLREIQTLMDCEHENIVRLREVVVGEDTSKIENIFLVLDFLEHDLKTLLTSLSEPFLPSELKLLLHQLTTGVAYLHNNYILHRDLKTSNLLLSNRGVLKIADFGMARYCGDPAPKMTQLVVTLWYRSPELLLGEERYGKSVDMWSVGCIFGELLSNDALLPGKNEVDQLSKIFELLGLPTESNWPTFKRLPNARSLRLPKNPNPATQGSVLRSKFPFLTSAGSSLLSSLLSLNPAKRPSAQEVLEHEYFKEDPKMKSKDMFPTFPSKAGLEKKRRRGTPDAPQRGEASKGLGGVLDFSGVFGSGGGDEVEKGAGFSLKLI